MSCHGYTYGIQNFPPGFDAWLRLGYFGELLDFVQRQFRNVLKAVEEVRERRLVWNLPVTLRPGLRS